MCATNHWPTPNDETGGFRQAKRASIEDSGKVRLAGGFSPIYDSLASTKQRPAVDPVGRTEIYPLDAIGGSYTVACMHSQRPWVLV